MQKKSVASEKDSVVKKVYTSGQYGHSNSDEGESSMEEGGQLDIQQKILVQLQKVSSRLEVESQMAVGQGSSKKSQKHGLKLSTVKQCSKCNCKKSSCVKTSSERSDSSDDDSVLPDLSHIRRQKLIRSR